MLREEYHLQNTTAPREKGKHAQLISILIHTIIE